jgi:hypothetical protein
MKVTSSKTLARLLFDRLAESGDPTRAVTLAQLLDDHLAYARVRPAFQLAGKGEYDVAILGLLADRTVLQADPALEAAARRELEAPEPGLTFAGALAERLLRLRDAEGGRPAEEDIAGEESGDSGKVDAEPVPRVFEPHPVAPVLQSVTEEIEGVSVRFVAPDAEPEPEPEAEPEPQAEFEVVDCWACAATLPPRPGIKFCPLCGVDQEAARCKACGDRREPGWVFCPRCGRALEE